MNTNLGVETMEFSVESTQSCAVLLVGQASQFSEGVSCKHTAGHTLPNTGSASYNQSKHLFNNHPAMLAEDPTEYTTRKKG